MHPEAMGQWILDVIDDGVRDLDRLEAVAPGLLRDWADNLETFGVDWPDWAKDAAYHTVMAGFSVQVGVLREILNAMRDRVARMGLPTVLRSEAAALEAGIGSVQERIATQCSSANLGGLTSAGWDSPASPHYLSAYEGQEDQVDALKTAVDGLVRVLNDAADSQDNWYSGNLFNTIGGVVGIAGLVVAIVGGIVTPLGWVGLALGIVGLLLTVIGYFIEAGDSQGRADTLTEVLSTTQLPAWSRPAFAQ